MRRTIVWTVCVACFGVVGLASATFAQEDAAIKPGPEHERLKALAGTWDAEITMVDGMKSKGVSTSKMECGGLWLATDFQAEFGGQKFHGKGFDGYDQAAKKYVAVWVDSMTTKPMNLAGTYDEASKTLALAGEGPGLDGKPAKFRSVTKMTDDDRHTFEMFITDPEGKEMKLMTIQYTRRKE